MLTNSCRSRARRDFVLIQSYIYDELNRLKSAQEMNGATQVWKQTFSYDRFGNRRFEAANTTLPQITPQNETSTNPAISSGNNRLTAAGYRYDLAGNLECDPTHPCGSTAPSPAYYHFDGDNRITTANGGASSGGSSYVYDGDGRRVKKIVGGPTPTTTVFVYDIAGQLIAEYSDQQPTGGGTSYLTADHLGTPRVITRANGSVSGRHDYQPFGEEIAASHGGRAGVAGYPASDGLRQQFTLKERDNETGLDYFLARYYSSTQGRFTSVDPLMASATASLPQSWNRYSYCYNNPLAFVDPDGRLAVLDDYYADRDGQITIDETPENFDRFYVENADGTYSLVATLQRNNAGLVQFPDNGTGFNRYGTVDAGGQDRATGENVGQGDHFLQPIVAAALFGTINVVNTAHQLTVSFGDMSSSNGSDPWQPGGQHHAGHGHNGNRSGLDIDFRYLNNNGVSFQSQTARSDPQFSVQNNQILYDTARTFGFTTNYQGTNRGNNGEIRGVTRAGGHNDHGHLGFNQANANVTWRTVFVLRP